MTTLRYCSAPIAAIASLTLSSALALRAESPPPESARRQAGASAARQDDGTGGDEEQLAVEAQSSARFVLPSTQHAWAKFGPGAWRTIRVIAHAPSNDAEDATPTVVVQTEVLKSVADARYVLDVQATVEIGGKQIVGNWRERELSILLDRPVERIEHRPLGEASVVVDSLEWPCVVWELAYEVDAESMIDRIHYAPQSPYVLLRESVQQGSTPGQLQQIQRTEYVGLQLPYVVLGETSVCDCRRRTTSGAKGRSVEIAFLCDAVPGGEAASWSTEWGVDGEIRRSSRTELVDYGELWREHPGSLLPRRRIRQERREDRRAAERSRSERNRAAAE